MDINQQNNLFAPPSEDELKGPMFAPPNKEELSGPMFAPPEAHEVSSPQVAARTQQDLFAPPTPQETAVDSEIKNRSFFDRPALIPQEIKDTDLQQIALKHGVPVDDLRSAVPWFAGLPEKASGTDLVKGVAGFAGTSAGLNIPQKLYKMAQDPKQESALDDLQSLIDARKSYAQVGAELATPIVGAVGTGGKLGKAALIGAGIGAGGGFGFSKAGEELKGIGLGAGIGAGVGVAGEKLAKYLTRGEGKLTRAEADLLKDPRTRQVDMDKITQEANQKFGKSESVLEESTFNRLDRQYLSPQDTKAVVDEYYGPEQVQRFLDSSTEEGQSIRRSTGSTSDAMIYDSLSNKAIDSRAKDFAEELSGVRPDSYEHAIKSIQEQENRQGPEYVKNKYKDYVEQSNVAKYLEDQGIRAQGRASNRPIEKISASQYVLDHYDDVYGTKLAEGLSELSKDTNRLTFIKQINRKALDDVYQLAKSTGRDESLVNGGAIIRAIETGKTGTLDEADRKLAEAVAKQFADIREFANKGVVSTEGGKINRLAIPEVENYVTRLPVDVPEMAVRIEQKMNRLKEDLTQQLGRPVNDLAQVTKQDLLRFNDRQGDLKDLTDFLSWKQSKQYVPRGGGELSGAIKDAIYTQEGNIALERKARSSLSRSDVTPLPGFIRETNLYNVMDKYSNDVLSSLYKRRGIDMLRKEAFKLHKLGADAEASYVEKLIQDTLGTRKGTAAAVMNSIKRDLAVGLDEKIRNAKDPVTRGALELAKSTPDIISFLGRQIYPNVLGWMNPRPILQNALSGITRTAPELGGTYGYTTYLRGLGNAALNLEKLNKESQRLGLIPADFTRQGEQALAEGIRRSGVLDKSIGAYEKAAKYGMAIYQKSEELNRAAILGTAQMMASDLSRNSPSAIQALSKFPFSMRKRLLEGRVNQQQTYETLAKYLNDRTAFNYNRQSMFELGRELGPLFTTFSKWPTEVAGEAIYDLRSKGLWKGAGRMTERLMLPIMALGSFDFIINEAGKDTDAYKKLVGSKGLKSAAPGNALASFTEGSIFTPPAVDAIMSGIISPVVNGDGPKLQRGLESLAYNYIPGGGLLKRMTEDLATIITGNRPQGSGTTERVIQGAKDLTR